MDSLRSPLGSESQDEWGSGLWMEVENDSGDERGRAPQEEDTHSGSPDLQQTDRRCPSGPTAQHFPSSAPAGAPERPPGPQANTPAHSGSPEDSDSIVLLSDDGEEQWVDCQPLDFTSTREEWVRRDSSGSLPPTPAFSRSSSRNLLTEERPDGQQGESEVHYPAPNTENQEVQQVCSPAPPLETVAGEQAANQDPGGPTCRAVVVKEPLREAAGGSREGRRESEQTDRERKQSLSGSAGGDRRRGSREGALGGEEKRLATADAQRADRTRGMDPEDSQSDSGVSADFSPNSTMDMSSTTASSSPDLKETPIEREIRLALKREQSLRRSRGLHPAEHREKEFVEIPVRRSILSQDLPLKSMRSEGKDRQFAGKKMQQEIRAEAEREKVLVQLGRLPGFYDKGTVRQLREKKLLFEAFQEPRETLEILNKRPSSVSSCENSSGGFPKEHPQNSGHLDPNGNYSTVGGLTWSSSGPRGPGLAEGTKGQVIILESTLSPVLQGGKASGRSATVVDGSGRSFSVKPYSSQNRDEGAEGAESGESGESGEGSALNQNPFFRLRSSLPLRPDMQQDIREAREREKELRKQRTSLYGPGSEVDAARSSTNPPSPRSNLTTPSPKTPGRRSLGKLEMAWPPPLQDEDKVQSEVQKSPKRQKSALLQRWENRLVNGHSEQD